MVEIVKSNRQYNKAVNHNRQRVKDRHRELIKRQPRWLYRLDGETKRILPSLDDLIYVSVEKVTIPVSPTEKGSYRIRFWNWNYHEMDVVKRSETVNKKCHGRTIYRYGILVGCRRVFATSDTKLLSQGQHRRIDILATIGHLKTEDSYYDTIEGAIYRPTTWLLPYGDDYEYLHNKPHQVRARKAKRDFWKSRRDDINRKVDNVKMRKINVNPQDWDNYY